MKILSVGQARTFWMFDLGLLNPRGLSLHLAFEQLAGKYKFSKAPQNPLDLNEQKALAFQVGNFVNSIKIAININFTIYNNGFSAETQSSTDDATEFLEEVSAWIVKEHGMVAPSSLDLKKGYVSQMDGESDTPLVVINPKLNAFLRLIEGRIKTADGNPRQFDLGAIQCWTEDVNQTMAPAPFRFERKWGLPFASNRYFTQSAFETQPHIDLLNELEKLLKS
jgi:hypothetical protein